MSGMASTLHEALHAMSMDDAASKTPSSSVPTTPHRRPATPRSPLPLVLVTKALGNDIKTASSVAASSNSNAAAGGVGSSSVSSHCSRASSSSTVSQSPTLSPVRENPLISDCIRSTRARRPPTLSSLYCHRGNFRASLYSSALPKFRHSNAVVKRRRRRRLRGIVSDDDDDGTSTGLASRFGCPPSSPSNTDDAQCELTYLLSELRTSSPACGPSTSLCMDGNYAGRDDVFSEAAGHYQERQNQQRPSARYPDSSHWHHNLPDADATGGAALSSPARPEPVFASTAAAATASTAVPLPSSCTCGQVQTSCRVCASKTFSPTSGACVSCRTNWDDTTPDELAAYVQHHLYIPRDMSDAAKMMYA